MRRAREIMHNVSQTHKPPQIEKMVSLSVNFSHDNVEGAHDGRNVRNRNATAELVSDRKITERAAAGSNSPWNRRSVAHQVKAHLPLRGLGFEVNLTLRQFLREFDRDAPIAFRRSVAVHCLTNQINGLHYLKHSHVKAMPAIA